MWSRCLAQPYESMASDFANGGVAYLHRTRLTNLWLWCPNMGALIYFRDCHPHIYGECIKASEIRSQFWSKCVKYKPEEKIWIQCLFQRQSWQTRQHILKFRNISDFVFFNLHIGDNQKKCLRATIMKRASAAFRGKKGKVLVLSENRFISVRPHNVVKLSLFVHF